MTVIKQLKYDVQDLNGILIPNKFVSVSLKVNDSAPKYLIQKSLVIQATNKRQGQDESPLR